MSIDEKIKAFNERQGDKKSYSVEEVVNMLGVTRQTVYKLIKQGCFEALLLDGTYRIKKLSFDLWLDNE